MSELTPEIAADVVAACQANVGEIGGACTRALDREFTATIGEAGKYDPQQPPEGFDGPGLSIALQFGDVGAVAVLPEATGLLPEWYTSPDPTGKSQLSTLAQELGMLLVPETLMVDEFHAFHVANIAKALADGKVADNAALVPITARSGDTEGQLSLIWPLATMAELKPTADEATPPTAPLPAVTTSAVAAPGAGADLSRLPQITRSLLKIRVPVSVCLATKKQTIKDISELVPGSIIKFDKSCEELLDLQIGDQSVADGEVVKVGEKFGLKIRSMALPGGGLLDAAAAIGS